MPHPRGHFLHFDVKTYLRTTMIQERLNNLIVLCICVKNVLMGFNLREWLKTLILVWMAGKGYLVHFVDDWF